MFPSGDPSLTAGQLIFAADCKGMPPSTTFVRDEDDDLLSASSQAPGALKVSYRDFHSVGAASQLEFPLATEFHAQELGDRLFQKDGKRDWRSVARLSPQSSGAGATSPTSVRSTHLLQVPYPETLTFLSAPGQVVISPSMRTDASIGLSHMGYQKCRGGLWFTWGL